MLFCKKCGHIIDHLRGGPSEYGLCFICAANERYIDPDPELDLLESVTRWNKAIHEVQKLRGEWGHGVQSKP